ncbi:hypothetical protein V491_00629 [Pseudogymnoascus sp. VKM F-3775]|nr:hypothetical protein V491_00629 [Pseudogymnoascus sp. VKM F-3775]
MPAIRHASKRKAPRALRKYYSNRYEKASVQLLYPQGAAQAGNAIRVDSSDINSPPARLKARANTMVISASPNTVNNLNAEPTMSYA